MGQYEEIKEKSAQLTPIMSMAKAAMAQGNIDKAIEYAQKFRNGADSIRCEYPSMFAAYVGYLNASDMLGQLYSKANEFRKAYAEFEKCLFDIYEFPNRNLDNEIFCQTLLNQTQYCLLELPELFEELSDNPDYKGLIYEYAKLFYYLYGKLKLINPENQVLTMMAPNVIAFLEHIEMAEMAEKDAIDGDCDDYISEIRHLSNKVFNSTEDTFDELTTKLMKDAFKDFDADAILDKVLNEIEQGVDDRPTSNSTISSTKSIPVLGQETVAQYELRQNQNEYMPARKELSRWNWGAFMFNWIWAICHRIYWPLIIILLNFIPYVGSFVVFGVCIYLGLKGTEMAWNAKSWPSWKSFKKKQQKWAKAALVVFVLVLILGIISAFVYDITL